MTTQLSNYFHSKRNRITTNSGSESDSPESKRIKNLNESSVSEIQDCDVIIDALEMTGGISEKLKKYLKSYTN